LDEGIDDTLVLISAANGLAFEWKSPSRESEKIYLISVGTKLERAKKRRSFILRSHLIGEVNPVMVSAEEIRIEDTKEQLKPCR
jgi:hypothetical protein